MPDAVIERGDPAHDGAVGVLVISVILRGWIVGAYERGKPGCRVILWANAYSEPLITWRSDVVDGR